MTFFYYKEKILIITTRIRKWENKDLESNPKVVLSLELTLNQL